MGRDRRSTTTLARLAGASSGSFRSVVTVAFTRPCARTVTAAEKGSTLTPFALDRTTNIAPPKGVPRDSAGHERPDAFFSRADGGEYSDDDEEFGDMVRRHPPKQASAKKKVVNGARGARGERPDKFIAGEDRGRCVRSIL